MNKIAEKICSCRCHKLGVKFVKTPNSLGFTGDYSQLPAIPCCNCEYSNEYKIAPMPVGHYFLETGDKTSWISTYRVPNAVHRFFMKYLLGFIWIEHGEI